MRLKSYYSATIEAAIRKARLELGDDAMLLESRSAPPEARHLGAHEVVFAMPEDDPAAQKREGTFLKGAGHGNGSAGSTRTAARNPLQDAARRDAEILAAAVAHSAIFAASIGGGSLDSELVGLYCNLCSDDFSLAICRDILNECLRATIRDGAGQVDRSLLRGRVRDALARRVYIEPSVGQNGTSSRSGSVALVGPPGAGKTSSLVKLAIQYGIPKGVPMQILSLDNLRVAASDQIRALGAILGIAVREIDRPNALEAVLRAAPREGWIWIDTPGFGPRDFAAMEELAAPLAECCDVDVQLVVPATMRSAELVRMWERYECFRPRKILVTHFDEAVCLGSLFTAMEVTKLPISFVSAGQQIPEDIQPASAFELLERSLDGLASLCSPGSARAYATAG